MIEFDFDPLKLTADILEALGLIVAASAQTESIIEMAICGCLKVSAMYGPPITAHMNGPLRDNVLRSVAQITIDNLDDLDELDQLLDNINTAIAKRNLYVHNSIGRDKATTDKFYIAKIESRGELDTAAIPVSAQQIKDDANAILQSGLRLMDFLMARDLLAKFPATIPEREHKSKAARKKRRKELLGKK